MALIVAGRPEEGLASSERSMAVGGRQSVRDYQKTLAAQGDDPGPIDGSYGARTRAALRACIKAGCLLVT